MVLHCWWERKLIQTLWKMVQRFLKKLEIKLPYDPEIPLLGIYPKKPKLEETHVSHCLFKPLLIPYSKFPATVGISKSGSTLQPTGKHLSLFGSLRWIQSTSGQREGHTSLLFKSSSVALMQTSQRTPNQRQTETSYFPSIFHHLLLKPKSSAFRMTSYSAPRPADFMLLNITANMFIFSKFILPLLNSVLESPQFVLFGKSETIEVFY